MYDFAESQLNTQFCANFSAMRRHETKGLVTRVLLRLDRHKIKLVGIAILWFISMSLLSLFMFMVYRHT